MLVLSLDMIPFGIKEALRNIGKIKIGNDGTGTSEIGNYNLYYRLVTDKEYKHYSRVENFDRWAGNAWDLSSIAIDDLIYELNKEKH